MNKKQVYRPASAVASSFYPLTAPEHVLLLHPVSPPSHGGSPPTPASWPLVEPSSPQLRHTALSLLGAAPAARSSPPRPETDGREKIWLRFTVSRPLTGAFSHWLGFKCIK